MSFKFSHTTEKQRANSSPKHKRIHSFLKHNPVGVLATIDQNDNPDASAIYFSIDGRFNIFFCTKTGTKKHSNLHHNNHVVLVAFDPISQTSVNIKGVIDEVNDAEKCQQIFLDSLESSLKTSKGNVLPISKLSIGAYAAFVLKPKEIVIATYGPSNGKFNNRIFENLEF